MFKREVSPKYFKDMSNLKRTLIHGLEHGMVIKPKTDSGHDPGVLNNDYPLYYLGRNQSGDFTCNCGGKWGGMVFQLHEIKPYLFDLTNLTNVIHELFPENETETYRIGSSSSYICITAIDREDGEEIDLYLWMDEVHNWPFWIIEELVKRHFNIFELSPDEFIRVTENNNPYR